MATGRISLDRAIAAAKTRFAEANDLFLHPLATTAVQAAKERAEIVDLLTELDLHMTLLEAVRDEMAVPEMIVDDITEAEAQRLREAVDALEVAIERTKTFRANLVVLAVALGALAVIGGAVKRGAAFEAVSRSPAFPR
jgi:hypothetical protein